MAFENLTSEYLLTVVQAMKGLVPKGAKFTFAESNEAVPQYFFASNPAQTTFFVFDHNRVGAGSFGHVHLGYPVNPQTGEINKAKPVALKRMFKHKTNDKEFEIEKAALRKGKDLITAGENEDCYFVVMKYVEGVNLGYYKIDGEQNLVMHLTPSLKDLPFEERIKAIWLLILDLDNLHSPKLSGPPILHRDIKPWNVMVATEVKENDGQYAKTVKSVRLVDYGLVHILSKQEEEVLTDDEKPEQEKFLTLRPQGTPGFMAPETLGHQINFRSEYYPFVALIWLLLGAINPLKDTKGLSLTNRVAKKYNSDGLFENIGPVPEELKQIIFDFTQIMSSHNFSERPDGQNLLLFFTAVHRYCINKNIEDLGKIYFLVYGSGLKQQEAFRNIITNLKLVEGDEKNKSMKIDIYLSPLYFAEQLVLEKKPGTEVNRDEYLQRLRNYRLQLAAELEKELAKGVQADQNKINAAKAMAQEYYQMTQALCNSQIEEIQAAAVNTAYENSRNNFWWNVNPELRASNIDLIIASGLLCGSPERDKAEIADIYLSPLYFAEELVVEKNPGTAAQRDEFLPKLTAYRNLFRTELAKELAKGDKADQNKINDAKEIALEYYEMTRTLCDPARSEEDQQAAIDKAYSRSTKNFWWNFFGLKLLKIALITAAAAFVGFIAGYAVGSFVGGTIFGYKFATAAASAYTAGVFGAGCGGKLGLSVGVFRFFRTPLEKNSKALKNAAEEMKVNIYHNPLLDDGMPMAVVGGPRQ